MKFACSHARAFAGSDIAVAIAADEGKQIDWVEVSLDGFSLETTALDVPSDSYEQTFASAGDAGPGMRHTLVVSARQSDGSLHATTNVWTDAV